MLTLPFSLKDIEEKPYNMCLNCAYIGKKCDGPNFLAMEMPRLCEWCRLRKDYLHNIDSKWTNAYIAEQSGMSKVSVDRFLSGNVDDLKASTIARILKVLVNGTWGQYPCSMASENDKEIITIDNPEIVAKLEAANKQCQKLQNTIDNMTAEHKENLSVAHNDEQRRIAFLKEQIAAKDKIIEENYGFFKRKNKVIAVLAILLAITTTTIITALIVDRLNPDKGFFWLGQYITEETIQEWGKL